MLHVAEAWFVGVEVDDLPEKLMLLLATLAAEWFGMLVGNLAGDVEKGEQKIELPFLLGTELSQLAEVRHDVVQRDTEIRNRFGFVKVEFLGLV